MYTNSEKLTTNYCKEKQNFEDERQEYLHRLVQNLNSMRLSEDLCDMHLNLGDGSKCNLHLALMSQYKNFVNSFVQDEDSILTESPIDISDINPKCLNDFIQLFYCGAIKLTTNNIKSFTILAAKLKLDDVQRQCEKYIIHKLTTDNCIDFRIFAQKHELPFLGIHTYKFILRHFTEVVQTNKDFLTKLQKDALCFIIDSDLLNVSHEEEVFTAIIQWVDYDLTARKQYFGELLSKLRTGLVNTTYLCSTIFKHSYVLEMKPEDLDIAFRYVGTRKSWTRIPRSVILVFQGWRNGHAASIIEAFDPRAEKWLIIHQMQFVCPRAYHGVVPLGKFVYVIGGYDGISYHSSVSCYDAEKHTWSYRSPMLEARCYVAAVAFQGIVYAFGGFNGQARNNSCERYAPGKNQWDFISSMWERRSDASTTVCRDKIFISGGFDGERISITTEVYDPNLNQWTLLCNMINPRSGHCLITCNGNVYAIGGFDGDERLKCVERYDAIRNIWVLSVPIQEGRSNFAVANLEGKIYIMGGFNGVSTFSSVERFDVETQRWQKVESLLFDRSALGACVLHDLEDHHTYSINGQHASNMMNEMKNEIFNCKFPS